MELFEEITVVSENGTVAPSKDSTDEETKTSMEKQPLSLSGAGDKKPNQTVENLPHATSSLSLSTTSCTNQSTAHSTISSTTPNAWLEPALLVAIRNAESDDEVIADASAEAMANASNGANASKVAFESEPKAKPQFHSDFSVESESLAKTAATASVKALDKVESNTLEGLDQGFELAAAASKAEPLKTDITPSGDLNNDDLKTVDANSDALKMEPPKTMTSQTNVAQTYARGGAAWEKDGLASIEGKRPELSSLKQDGGRLEQGEVSLKQNGISREQDSALPTLGQAQALEVSQFIGKDILRILLQDQTKVYWQQASKTKVKIAGEVKVATPATSHIESQTDIQEAITSYQASQGTESSADNPNAQSARSSNLALGSPSQSPATLLSPASSQLDGLGALYGEATESLVRAANYSQAYSKACSPLCSQAALASVSRDTLESKTKTKTEVRARAISASGSMFGTGAGAGGEAESGTGLEGKSEPDGNYESKSGGRGSTNIFWATDDYASLGKGYQYADPILPHLITKEHFGVIRPRVMKLKSLQSARSRNMAEVFTPAWICNAQNNLIDAQWFGRDQIFNVPYQLNGQHLWQTIDRKIEFPVGKTWQDYVLDVRLEVSCGEAPYLVSRYDAVNGQLIPLKDRIGLLDRKLRVVSENTTTPKVWFAWAMKAYQSLYAYEWQGDSLLLARVSMFLSFLDYFKAKFGKLPARTWQQDIAKVISWNVWQMDGLKGVIPNSCQQVQGVTEFLGVAGSTGLLGLDDLQSDSTMVAKTKGGGCPGCLKHDLYAHNGVYCLIKDWFADAADNALDNTSSANTSGVVPVRSEEDSKASVAAAALEIPVLGDESLGKSSLFGDSDGAYESAGTNKRAKLYAELDSYVSASIDDNAKSGANVGESVGKSVGVSAGTYADKESGESSDRDLSLRTYACVTVGAAGEEAGAGTSAVGVAYRDCSDSVPGGAGATSLSCETDKSGMAEQSCDLLAAYDSYEIQTEKVADSPMPVVSLAGTIVRFVDVFTR